MRARAVLLCSAAALSGCFGAVKLESTLPAAPPRLSYVGVETAAITPDGVEPAIAQLQEALKARMPALNPALKPTLREAPGHALELSLESDPSFEPGSAQLHPSALADYASVAGALATRGAFVVHVLVFDTAAPSGPASLAARRAATLRGYLEQRGVAATRLRGEGRDGTPRVALVLEPVVAGREPEAWMPPPA